MKVESIKKVVEITVTLSEAEAAEIKYFLANSPRHFTTPMRDLYNGLVLALRKT